MSEEEFREFYAIAADRAYRAVRSVGGDHHEAQDAVSDAMEEVLRRWPDVRSPVGYVCRAAVTDFMKEKSRRLRQVEAARRSGAGDEARDDLDLTLGEDDEWVSSTLGRLPDEQRKVMTLYVEGVSQREIAVRLDKTEAAVRKNMQLARANLRQELDRRAQGAPRQRTGRRAGETGREQRP